MSLFRQSFFSLAISYLRIISGVLNYPFFSREKVDNGPKIKIHLLEHTRIQCIYICEIFPIKICLKNVREKLHLSFDTSYLRVPHPLFCFFSLPPFLSSQSPPSLSVFHVTFPSPINTALWWKNFCFPVKNWTSFPSKWSEVRGWEGGGGGGSPHVCINHHCTV